MKKLYKLICQWEQRVFVFSAGRPAGADIARTEQLREGRVPLHTLRENIDYCLVEANIVYERQSSVGSASKRKINFLISLSHA